MNDVDDDLQEWKEEINTMLFIFLFIIFDVAVVKFYFLYYIDLLLWFNRILLNKTYSKFITINYVNDYLNEKKRKLFFFLIKET